MKKKIQVRRRKKFLFVRTTWNW